MENDSIRPSGNETLVDIWIEGKLRAICVTREAIEAIGGFDAGRSEESRCDFVRTHLPQIVTAAKAKMRGGNGSADSIVIGEGEIGAHKDARNGERRKGERRKTAREQGALPEGERRRGERRWTERRRSKKPS